ncbi:hypothetical protein CLOM_g7528 [Closterium sp. NIES-68]|nr:hypothetical protein CLOM_g7528 [Closterium sp. NIES-68]
MRRSASFSSSPSSNGDAHRHSDVLRRVRPGDGAAQAGGEEQHLPLRERELRRRDAQVGPRDLRNWTADESLYSLRRVRDQGSCGSSWAMAAVTAVELAYAVVRNASNDMAAPRYLSTQQVLNCVSSKTGNCTGGWPTTAMDYVVKATDKYGGMVTEGNYPYKGNRTTSYGTKDDDDDDDDSDDKKKSKCDTSKVKKKATKIGIRSYESIDYYGWLGLILAVQVHPAIALVNSALDSFRNYESLGPFFTSSIAFRGRAFQACTRTQRARRGRWTTPWWWWVHLLVARAPLDPQKFLGASWGMNGYMHLAMQGGLGACNIHSVPALVPVIKTASTSPCSLLVNPCGSGVCIPSGSTKYKCQCPLGFVAVKNSDGTQSCTPVVVCTRADINPCGFGTCLNDGKGDHACLCPRGFALGTTAVGSQTCVPSDKTIKSIKVPVTVPARVVYGLYGIPKDQFYAQNPDLDSSDSKIKKGKKVDVKATSDTVSCGLFYPWNWGNRCWAVAALFGITVSQLKALNPGLTCPAGAYPGQQICVREGSGLAIPLCAQYHVIASPDTCVSIRQQYSLSWSSFFALNPGVFCSNLYPAATVDGLTTIPSGAQICVKAASNATINSLVARGRSLRHVNDHTHSSHGLHHHHSHHHPSLVYDPSGLLSGSLTAQQQQQQSLQTVQSVQPQQQQAQQRARCRTSYTVVRGDFCARIIALKFQYNTRRMSDLNNGYVCTNARLFVGLVLCTFR